MGKKVLIVGAGIAGLSAGCYAALNGYETSIHEMHDIPGGLCTAWDRKGYKFDISMHMLTGSHSGPFNRMWKELGIVEGFEFHSHSLVTQVESDGIKLRITTDRKQTEADMLRIAPEDRKEIKKFLDLIYRRSLMNAASLKPAELQTLGDKARAFRVVLPSLGKMMSLGNTTVMEYAERFRNPFLKQVIRFFDEAPGWPMNGFPAAYMTGYIDSCVNLAAAPLGGSQQVVFSMADLFRKRGGELHLKSKVSNLLMNEDRVTGIELEDGTRHDADTVIWAADGRTLIYDILGGRYTGDAVEGMYKDWKVVKSIFHVCIGVDMELSGEPHKAIFQPDETITIAGREHRHLMVLHHGFQPNMAPAGKTAVELWYDTDSDYWVEQRKDRRAYRKEKQRIADYSVDQLEKRWPGFKGRVEVVDVATPATYVRYTGNWKGSPDGWYITPDNMMNQEPVRHLPGLKNLWMAGQWTAPFTGTVMASLSGRQVVQLMCRDDGKDFRGD